jgi:hypothetical protein
LEFHVRKLSFIEPVYIFVGLGFPRDVGDVLDAYKILNEWPLSSRDAGHLHALHTCATVLGGHGTATEARRAFETFASEHGILAPEALQKSADRLGREWLAKPDPAHGRG